MELSLKGKKAIVCGSTQGIGKACAIELALLGADIILIARKEDKLKEMIKELKNDGQHHDYIVADFLQPELLKEKIGNYLKNKIIVNILVNNTGGPAGGPIINALDSEFINAYNSHLICNHILVQAVVEGMKKSAYGRIINIISTSVKQPIKGLGVSNTTRAAVASWAKTLSIELGAFGITVNNVLPGATNTGRLGSIIDAKADKLATSKEKIVEELLEEIPAGRFAEPFETASAVAFLASPAAAYINGINLPVDGGRTASL